ncbi:MAG: hypothetical protein R2784_20410 [Saprospiraceae bacterium]
MFLGIEEDVIEGCGFQGKGRVFNVLQIKPQFAMRIPLTANKIFHYLCARLEKAVKNRLFFNQISS